MSPDATGRAGDVEVSAPRVREIAAAFQERGSTAASSVSSGLSGAKQFPMPRIAAEVQSSAENLLSSLDEVPQLLEAMSQRFYERAMHTAQTYDAVENHNVGLIESTGRDLA